MISPTPDPAARRALVARLEALGDEVSDALPPAPAIADTDRLASLVRERDALLAQLAHAMAVPAGDGQDLSAALERAAGQTQSLIAQVAERTDALRQALRDLDRSARATDAYHQSPPGGWGRLDARR